MACRQEQERYLTLKKMRDLAEKAAKIDNSAYYIIERQDKSLWYVKRGDKFTGKIKETVLP